MEWEPFILSEDRELMPSFFTLLTAPPAWFEDSWTSFQNADRVDELPQWFIDLVSDDGNNHQSPECFASFKPVSIDTASSEGGVARTSFLFLEVETKDDIFVEVEACPEGYGVPLEATQCIRHAETGMQILRMNVPRMKSFSPILRSMRVRRKIMDTATPGRIAVSTLKTTIITYQFAAQKTNRRS